MKSTIPRILGALRPARLIHGCSALLLPFLEDGSMDVDGFQRLLHRTFAAGLTPAVNMDTGYVNLLSDDDRASVLSMTREIAAGRLFIAGAFIEGKTGNAFELYREQMLLIYRAGGCPIIFPCGAIQALDRPSLVALFRQLGEVCPRFLAFELGEMFAPFGRIFDLPTVADLLQIPALVGMKHSSLNRELEWERLALKERERPDFHVYTGNDLAIDMVMYGSDYLLGLSAFHPEAFALRDALWRAEDPGFYPINDLLQYLGFLAFRPPVPGYKHNAAQFLKLRGLIAASRAHPKAATRPDSDVPILSDILERLDTLIEDLENNGYALQVSQILGKASRQANPRSGLGLLQTTPPKIL